jgi:hypothetical protein
MIGVSMYNSLWMANMYSTVYIVILGQNYRICFQYLLMFWAHLSFISFLGILTLRYLHLQRACARSCNQYHWHRVCYQRTICPKRISLKPRKTWNCYNSFHCMHCPLFRVLVLLIDALTIVLSITLLRTTFVIVNALLREGQILLYLIISISSLVLNFYSLLYVFLLLLMAVLCVLVDAVFKIIQLHSMPYHFSLEFYPTTNFFLCLLRWGLLGFLFWHFCATR